MSRFDVAAQKNTDWTASAGGQRITVTAEPFISRHSKIFAMGSCFAVEIRNTLRTKGYDVYPKYLDLAFDPDTQSPGLLSKRDNINHYDTFTIRQEILRAIERRNWPAADFWLLTRSKINKRKNWPNVWQDPYRRQIFASNKDALIDISDRLGSCISDGLAAADVVILTLGLTECWRHRDSGLFVCLGPRDEDDEVYPLVEFVPTSFADNYANLRTTIDRILAISPTKKIVLTVSPVPLRRTWTANDVVVANMSSKTTLRAMVAQICRETPEIIYWPSFEFAITSDIYQADGRHVRPDAVDQIVTAFLSAHSR